MAEQAEEEDDEDDEDEEHDEDDEFVGESDASTQASDNEEGSWGEGGDGDEDEDDDKGSKKNLCIHCDEDEDNDPASDFEEGLECVACDAFSHRQCDRSANEEGGVKSAFDEDTSQWQCPNCASSGQEIEVPVPSTVRNSRSRRSTTKESEQESRTLRKRKRNEEDEDDGPVTRRRKRRDKHKQTNGDRTPTFKEEDVQMEGSDDGKDATSVNGEHTEVQHKVVQASITKGPGKMALRISNIEPSRLLEIFQQPPRPSRAGRSRTPATLKQRATPQPAASSSINNHYPAAYDDEKIKPYGGILSEADANTALTLPGTLERKKFEKAKEQADAERKARTMLNESLAARSKRRTDNTGGASKIECIHFGDYEIDTWYAAPYPEEYSRNRVLWICEFCLKYMNSEYVCWRHKTKCDAKHPPGDEIYRDRSISVFEIDGRKNPVYCQNLCLLAKLFLGSKTLYYDVEPFLFYVMTECDENGMHFVGYFSKEKRSTSQNNVSCILTLPIHQRKGYGNLLIAFSYLLTRVEGKTGSPEKPFSDLGLVSYRNYWKLVLCYQLRNQKEPLTIGDLSDRTGMTPDDIICGLEALNALVRDPVTGYYALRLDYAAFQAQIDRWEAKGYVKLNESSLIWTPYLMGRSQAEHLNDMPISTIAPRPEEQEVDQETADATEDPIAASADKSAGDEANRDRTSNNGNSSTLINGNGSTIIQPQHPYTQGVEIREAGFNREKPDGSGDPGTSDSSVVNESSARSTPTTAIKLGQELPSSVSNDVVPASRKKPTRSKSNTSLAVTPVQVQPNAIDYDIPDIPPTRFEIVPPLPGSNNSNTKRGGRRGAGESSVLRSSRKRTSISPAIVTPLPSRSTRSLIVPGTAPPAITAFGSSTKTRRTRTKLGQAITVNGDSSRRSETPSSTNGVVTRDRRGRTQETSVAPEIQPAEINDNGDVQGTNTTTTPTTTDHPSPGIRPGGFNMVVASEV